MFRAIAASKADFVDPQGVAHGLQSGCTEDNLKHGARLFYAIAATLGAVVSNNACSSDSAGDAALEVGDNGNGTSTAGTGTGLGPGTPVTTPEPEKEVDKAFRVPVV